MAVTVAAGVDVLDAWRRGVTVSRVAPVSPPPSSTLHTLHAYYTACPESPDGRHVVYYTSQTREGYAGEIRILDRTTGEERVLVRDVAVEDTHRAACQQWVSGGRRVVFHDVRGPQEEWLVASVDVVSGEQRVLARGRQLGWGQPGADLVPVYGPHWDAAAYRHLDVVNVVTGEQRTVLRAEAVQAAYPELIAQELGDGPLSIFFPALSPDLTRVFFKMARPLGGHFRSKAASQRALLICYSLAEERFLFADRKWGHPAWHPSSRTILDVPNVLIDADTGERRALTEVPRLPGSHPSFSPGGSLYVSDVSLERMEGIHGAPGEWGVVVVDVDTQEWTLIHRFDDSHGAASWRRCHPHPVFSADGRRIYFTTSSTPWSRLHVAESAPVA